MPSRRTVVALLGAAPLAAALRPRLAGAAPPPGLLFDGEIVEAPGPGLQPVKLRGGFARLGAQWPVVGRSVFSVANANDRFKAVLELPKVPTRMGFVTVAGGVVAANSWGTGFLDRTPGSTSADLDLALADELARVWKVPRQDRKPLGTGLVGRFRPKAQPFAAGGPMEIVLEVENRGADSPGFSVGGRNRGPRDNRFAFVVSQRGQALPVLAAMDFGGLMQYAEMKPGAKRQVTADLAGWTPLSVPGTYQVECSYSAEVTPGAASPSWPDHGHEVWDLTLTETIQVTVA